MAKYNLAELKKKTGDELRTILKTLLGDAYKEDDYKDKEVSDLSEVVIDKQFEAQHSTLFSQDKKSLVKIIEDTRLEAKNNRLDAEKERKLKNDLLSKTNDEEIKKLVADGKTDEAVAKLQTTINEMSTNFEQFKLKATAFDNQVKAKKTELKERLGDKWKEKYENYDIEDLTEIADSVAPVKPPEEKPKPKPTNQNNQTTPLTADEMSKKSPEEKLVAGGLYKTE